MLSELHVHCGASNLYNVSDIFSHDFALRFSLLAVARSFLLIELQDSAAAPLTISIISLVIAAWRTRLRVNVSESITSLALLVAESIAVMRAACSAATDSNSA